MAEVDLEQMERRLLDERDRTLDAIQQAESEEQEGQRQSAGELSRLPTHLADAASDTQEAEKDLATIHRETEKLTEIDEALRVLRQEPESYVKCRRCGSAIAAERLDLIPWTRLCAECAKGGESVGAGP